MHYSGYQPNTAPRPSKLRNDSPRDRMAAEIVKQISSGALRAGDRLMSINRLCELYPFSRRAVIGALEDLVKEGILRAKSGSGFYVQERANLLIQALHGQAAEFDTAPASTEPITNYADFLEPRRRTATLCVYVSEIFSCTLRLWREMLDDFVRSHKGLEIEILSCSDGHVEDLWRRHEIDLVLSVPEILSHLGKDQFRLLDDAALTNLHPECLIDPVRMMPNSGGMENVCMPFCISVPRLYANTELVQPGALDGQASFIDLIGEASRLVSGKPGISMSFITSLLMVEGAITRDNTGELCLSAQRMQNCLERLRNAHIISVGTMPPENAFLEQKVPLLYQMSYAAIHLRNEAKCEWQPLPLPFGPGGVAEGTLMALAISRRSRLPHEALELVQHMTSPDVQRRFGMLGGNLPVRREALEDAKVVSQLGFTPESLAASLSHTLAFRDKVQLSSIHRVVEPAGHRLLAGENTQDEILRGLRYILHEA